MTTEAVVTNTQALDVSTYTDLDNLIDQQNIIINQTAGGGFHPGVTIFFTLGECLIGLATLLGNALVLFVIVRWRRLQTFTNYFIASLAMADLLVGAVGIPCSLVAFFGRPSHFWGCLLMNTVIIIFTQISIFGLVTISLERFFAIHNPFFYEKHCHGVTAAVVIIFTWVLAITIGLVPVFGWNMKATYHGEFCGFTDVVDMDYMVFFNFFGFVLGPLVIMFSVYCYIFHIVRRQLKQISSLEVSTGTNSKSTAKKARESFMKELRAAKWFAVVIFLFAVCWLPLHIMNAITRLQSPVPAPYVMAAIMLSHLNSAVNPILYAYSNAKFKTAMKKVLQCNISQNALDSASGMFISQSAMNHHSTNNTGPKVQSNNGGNQKAIRKNGKYHRDSIQQQDHESHSSINSTEENGKRGYVNKALDLHNGISNPVG